MDVTRSITCSTCATRASPTDREPDLILLDLNLPGLDGCQVLTQIKSDPFLRMIPVVILTTSHREEDILQTYLAGANTYIPKPAEYPSYRELVATLHHYWVDTALKVPHHLRRKSADGSPSCTAPARFDQDFVAPSFNPMKLRTCWVMASSVGSRSIELAP